MAAVKHNRKRKKSGSKLRGKGNDDSRIEALNGNPRPASRPPKAGITVTKDSYIENFYRVHVQLGKMEGVTTFSSDATPDRRHPVIAKLLKQMRDSYS